MKIFHMDKLHGFFPDFDFRDADNEDGVFLDALHVVNDLAQSSY